LPGKGFRLFFGEENAMFSRSEKRNLVHGIMTNIRLKILFSIIYQLIEIDGVKNTDFKLE